ncbi:MAG: DUF7499 family protein [Rhabdochlamydiaceae bacterium]
MIFRSLSLFSFCMCFLVGCSIRRESKEELLINNISKPVVCVAPVVNRVDTTLNWDLGEEFTYLYCDHLSSKDRLYVLSLDQAKSLSKLSFKDPFGENLNWIPTIFEDQDMVIFSEILDYKQEGRYLDVSIRVRALDIRNRSNPQIILQEITDYRYNFPKAFSADNFHHLDWKEEGYFDSPLAKAHEDVTKKLMDQVAGYIYDQIAPLQSKGSSID